MLQLQNSTPFVADIAIFPNEQGVDTLYLVAKATFDVGRQLTLAEQQAPLNRADAYRGDAQHSSPQQTCDYHLGKQGTDVLVSGDCMASGEGAIRQSDVHLEVGPVAKTLRVFGDRVWDSGRITAPSAFERIPLIYEHAFGGIHYDENGGILAADTRNPAGLGFMPEPNERNMQGVRLPNVEDPQQLIHSPNDRPQPAGCGAIAPFWAGRSCYAGTFDEHWQTQRAPFLPEDFDKRFFQIASPGLVCQSFLHGGEPVRITNMHESGEWSFKLPVVALVGHVIWRKRNYALTMDLETVELEPNHSRLVMTWRTALAVNQHALKVEAVTLKMQRSAAAQAV